MCEYIGASKGAREFEMILKRTVFGSIALAALASGCVTANSEGPMKRSATGIDPVVRAALADAARVSGIDASRLKVADAARVVWPDGSLGCPEPGMMYAQALTPGYRIRIRAGDAVLDYHASERGELILCPPGRATEPLPDTRK